MDHQGRSALSRKYQLAQLILYAFLTYFFKLYNIDKAFPAPRPPRISMSCMVLAEEALIAKLAAKDYLG